MIRQLTLLLLLCCFINNGIPTVGNITIHVTGREGENATLPCGIQAGDIFHVILTRLSKPILDCQNEQCKSESEVFKKGACDIIIKHLRLRDAGKYILRVHINDKEQQIKEYHLHIQDEISVNTGEELKLDVLLINADKVETNSSGEWTEVWTRGHGVSSDRLTDSDGNLTIKKFTATDTGTYRVLDSKNETLITVTVTESGTGSGSERTDDKPDDTEQHMYWFWRVGLPVIVVLVLVGVIIFIVFKKPQCLNGGYLLGRRSPEQSEGL